jgi:hypothetical protein
MMKRAGNKLVNLRVSNHVISDDARLPPQRKIPENTSRLFAGYLPNWILPTYMCFFPNQESKQLLVTSKLSTMILQGPKTTVNLVKFPLPILLIFSKSQPLLTNNQQCNIESARSLLNRLCTLLICTCHQSQKRRSKNHVVVYCMDVAKITWIPTE